MMRQPARFTLTRFIGPAAWRFGRRGLTLAECVFALVILPLAVTAIAYAVTAGQMQSAEALRQSRAGMLAEALMEEILSKSYNDPDGSEAGETRTTYDDVNDYNNFSEASNNLRNVAGTLYPAEFQRFRRTATVAAGTVTLTGLGSAAPGFHITVTVSDAAGAVCTLRRFMVQP